MTSAVEDTDPALAETQATQRRVARPEISAWVEANAGAGKTTVLTNRVIRLLLSGARPANILCITFTKAAAAEMKARLFSQLGAWALMPDTELSGKLEKLDPEILRSPASLSRARKLFAQALEVPGGLKIQTIHSFCESVLRRFPLEASISPSFTVMEERDAAGLRQSIIDKHAATLVTDPRSGAKPPSLFRILLDQLGRNSLLKYLNTIISVRTDILKCMEKAGGKGAYLETIKKSCDIEPSLRLEDLQQAYRSSIDEEEFKSLAGILREHGGKRGTGRAAAFEQIIRSTVPAEAFRDARKTFLTQKGTRFGEGYLYPKELEKTAPGAKKRLTDLQGQFFATFQKALTLRDLTVTQNLMDLAVDIITDYQTQKYRRGVLDFEDLITATADLFRSTSADWVLYKLDTGLDHILLDEAQDTSAAQWDVIMAPLREFFAGSGQTAKNRTAFVVGDEKQSIYSFNGADIDLFRQYQDTVYSLGSSEKPVRIETINLSFRSAEPVLSFVDTLFNHPTARKGVLGPGITLEHGVFRKGAAGIVEIWPLIETEKPETPAPWDAPLDAQSQQSAPALVARAITAKIEALLSGGILPAKGGPVLPGDILVLFRKRQAVFDETLKQLGKAGIPTTGADRLKIKDSILVQDMICAAAFILQPHDDLSLATFLKSPFAGFSEEELYGLACQRSGSLWRALQKDGADKSTRAVTLLRTIRRTGFLEGPYSFFAQLLDYSGPDSTASGWVRAKERLGDAITDPVTEFLNEAVAYEGRETRSLQGFLHYFAALETTIKRDLDGTDNAVRLMTVHGAKGLQAPIVFLADAGLKMGAKSTRLRPLPDPRLDGKLPYSGYYIYNDKRAGGDAQWGGALSPHSEKATELAQQYEEEESKRLLYVAATRAEYQLYVAGHKQTGADLTWHGLAATAFDALEKQGRVEVINDGAAGSPAGSRRIDCPQLQAMTPIAAAPPTATPPAAIPAAAAPTATVAEDTPPAWLHTPAPIIHLPKTFRASNALDEQYTAEEKRTRAMPLSDGTLPSQPDPAGGHFAPVPVDQQNQATGSFSLPPVARGVILHRLLEILPAIPPEERPRAAIEIFAKNHPNAPRAVAEDCIAEVIAVLGTPTFTDVFSPQSRAEVSVMGELSFGGTPYPFSGQIDRLVVKDDEILIVDYKTNRPPPETAAAVAPLYLEQLAIYRALLRQIYPGKPIGCALLWTYVSILMPIPDDLLDTAFDGLAEKMAAQGRSA